MTSVLVAEERTAALELPRAVLRKPTKLRRVKPAMPKSVNACPTHPIESARTLGAFCLDMGS